ncbi:GNAT family protein [Staphylococcus chromogenes]|nr:GNAT family protein [Staphylococcus chromogenes]
MKLSDIYPPFGLELRSGEFRLKPADDASLQLMGEINHEDIFVDPNTPWVFPWSLTPKPLIALETARFHWGLRAKNSPDDWQIPFIAFAQDKFIGSIDLRATKFSETRTVETGSYVLSKYQNQGYGTAMRELLATYCFDWLQASTMRSKWHPDNAASAQVSTKLGYTITGTDEEDGQSVVVAELAAENFCRIPIEVTGHTRELEQFLGVN